MQDCTLISRPWWISHAVATHRGVIVARADAISTINRWPTPQDIADGIAANRYDSSLACHGEFVEVLVDLTESDLSRLALVPGTCAGIHVKDGKRPATNRSDKPVSQAQQQRAIDLIQSESHCDDADPEDKTPWQKGDDQAI